MSWTQVSVVTDGEAAEAVAEIFTYFSDSVVLVHRVPIDSNGDGITSELGEEVTVSIYLPEDIDTPEERGRIEEALWHLGQLHPLPQPTYSVVDEEDWAGAWKQHFTPLRIGQRILVCPVWETPDPRPGDIVVLMDPGMAFGTGLHPTTRMCLETVEEQILPGMSVLDVGTGSGILAIAAARLGAEPVLALDTDQVAVQAARKNCSINEVTEVAQVVHGSLVELQDTRTWDVVLVNILAPVILQLLDDGLVEHVRPGGLIVLSGVIERQVPPILAALEQHRVSVVSRRRVEEWVTLCCRPSAAE